MSPTATGTPGPPFQSRRPTCSTRGVEPGAGPGQFNTPTASRSTARASCWSPTAKTAGFSGSRPGGEFIDEWTDVARPCDIFIDPAGRIFVAELGFRAGMFASMDAASLSGGRLSIFSPKGEVLARFGGGVNPCVGR